MGLQTVNFTQNKLALKPIQEFPLHFGPARRKLWAVINGLMNSDTINK